MSRQDFPAAIKPASENHNGDERLLPQMAVLPCHIAGFCSSLRTTGCSKRIREAPKPKVGYTWYVSKKKEKEQDMKEVNQEPSVVAHCICLPV
jgi:hypothetical protein